jgi:plasmid maintenance system antidote protein VapI
VAYFIMESTSRAERLTFSVLQFRLIRLIASRLHNGEFTERGLARILRISQPHLHHVLKQTRKLRPELADVLMLKLGLNILDLVENSELRDECLDRREQISLPAQDKS